MPRHNNHHRRYRRHVPKHVYIPVMPELQNSFAVNAVGAFASMCMVPNRGAFNQLGDIFNVIAIGLNDIGQKSIILESGMRALQDVGNRAEKTGHLGIARHEIPPIRNAVTECEALVKKLDVIGLHMAGMKLDEIAAAQRKLKTAA